MIDFKGTHYPKSVILHAVFFYVRYAVLYRDLEEIMLERVVDVDHATLNRWVVKYAPLVVANAQARKRPTTNSWRMGAWTRPISKLRESGLTSTAPLIVTAKPLISCCQNCGIQLPPGGSSSR